jgi:hypothetical protein
VDTTLDDVAARRVRPLSSDDRSAADPRQPTPL